MSTIPIEIGTSEVKVEQLNYLHPTQDVVIIFALPKLRQLFRLRIRLPVSPRRPRLERRPGERRHSK